jgi:hypothetical protein
MKRRAIAVGVIVLSAVFASMGLAPAASQKTDPLVGTWDSGLISIAKIRATLSAHGYAPEQIEKYVHVNNHFMRGENIEIRFYRDGGVPFQIVYAWDPTHGIRPDGDHGPYVLLSGSKFVSRGTDPPTDTWRTTYSYKVLGTRLSLHFVSLVEPGLSAKQRASDEKRPILMSSVPFKKA